jgi:hypothetical protein
LIKKKYPDLKKAKNKYLTFGLIRWVAIAD